MIVQHGWDLRTENNREQHPSCATSLPLCLDVLQPFSSLCGAKGKQGKRWKGRQTSEPGSHAAAELWSKVTNKDGNKHIALRLRGQTRRLTLLCGLVNFYHVMFSVRVLLRGGDLWVNAVIFGEFTFSAFFCWELLYIRKSRLLQ